MALSCRDPYGGEHTLLMNAAYTVRNYTPADLQPYVRLRNAYAEVSADKGYLTARAVQGLLARPGYDPAKQLFVAEGPGGIVAYLDVISEPRIGRAILEGYVAPGSREHGLASAMCRPAAARASGDGARALHVLVREDNAPAQAAMKEWGFSVVHRALELELDLPCLPPAVQTSLPVRALHPEEAAVLADLQNRCFAGSWGFSPNEPEDISHEIEAGDAAAGIRIAMDGGRPAAYCWTTVQRDSSGASWGRISMIGVDPAYQGRGLGRQLLITGLRFLKERGLSTVRLTVLCDNTPARALYETVGFRVRYASLWHERRLD